MPAPDPAPDSPLETTPQSGPSPPVRDVPFVSRAGLKLDAALQVFELNVSGLICADFGSHTGGFVDCLLRRGAARVYAIDPGYGVLDYRLRRDPRVVVCERTNALQWLAPEPCDLVTIDVGWTPQRLILPSARRALRMPTGHVVTLVKPHYEADKALLRDGVLPPEALPTVLDPVRADCAVGRWSILRELQSPILGHGGNREFLWLLVPTPS